MPSFLVDDSNPCGVILTIGSDGQHFVSISNSDSSTPSNYQQSPSDLLNELLYHQNPQSGKYLGQYVNDTEIQKIKDSLDLGFAPSGQKLKMYYDAVQHEHKSRSGKEVKIIDPNEVMLPVFPYRPGTNFRLTGFGPAGVGKTRLLARIIEFHLLFFPDTKIYVFSRLDHDPSLDPVIGKNIFRFPMDESILMFDPTQIEPRSICVFDDIETLVNQNLPPKTTKMIIDKVREIRDDFLKTGRHQELNIVSICHDLMGAHKTKIVHIESTHIYFFLREGYDDAIKRMLTTHYGLSKEEIDRLFKLPATWVMLSRRNPRFIMYRGGCYFL